MAEVLGVVASGISIGSLAIQLASSVQKIIDCWRSMKDAPRNIQSLLEEVKILSHLLVEFDIDEDKDTLQKATTAKEIELCKAALSDVNDVLAELSLVTEVQRKRRHWAALKVAFSEKRLSKCLSRLERAKSMLTLAHSCCILVNQRRIQSQIAALLSSFQNKQYQFLDNALDSARSTVSARLPTTKDFKVGKDVSSISDPKLDTAARIHKIREVKCSSRELFFGIISLYSKVEYEDDGGLEHIAQTKELLFRMHACCGQRGFSMSAYRYYELWHCSFRSYRILDFKDPIYYACISGDLSQVMRLCAQGHATPFDTMHTGWTLLHVAAAFARPNLCKWLLSQGVDANACGKLEGPAGNEFGITSIFTAGTTPLHVAASCSGRTLDDTNVDILLSLMVPHNYERANLDIKSRPSDVLDTIRGLIESGADPAMNNESGETALHLHTGSIAQFRYLLRQEHIQTFQMNYRRDTVAERHIKCFWPDGPQRAKLAFRQEICPTAGCKAQYKQREPCLISSMSFLLQELAGHFRHYIDDVNAFKHSVNLIQDLVRRGVNLHESHPTHSKAGKSPLRQVPTIPKDFDMDDEGFGRENVKLNRALSAWLKTLEEVGVDIDKYLSTEAELTLRSEKTPSWERYDFDESLEWRVIWRFEYNRDTEFTLSAQYCFRTISRNGESTLRNRFQRECKYDSNGLAWLNNHYQPTAAKYEEVFKLKVPGAWV